MKSFVITIFIICCSILAICWVSAAPTSPIYSCTGTYFTCGEQIGTQARDKIKARITQKDFLKAFNYITNSARGKFVFDRFVNTIDQEYPELLDEISGIAHGAGLDFDQAFLLNSLDEFGALEAGGGDDEETSSKFKAPPSCTDVLSNVALDDVVHGHNEDNDGVILGLTYIVNATIYSQTNSNEILERFISFAYPGTVGGDYFAFNSAGLTFSDNYIFTKHKEFDVSIPSSLKGRIMYRCKSVDEVVLRQMQTRGATGYNWNVGSTKAISLKIPYGISSNVTARRMMNIESDPLGGLAVNEIPAAIASFSKTSTLSTSTSTSWPHIENTSSMSHWFAHTNMFVNLNSSNEALDESSVIRRQRILQIVNGDEKNVKGVDSIRKILGDTESKDFPIYRSGNSTADNHIATLATVIYDLINKKAYVWHNNPKTSQPEYVFDLW